MFLGLSHALLGGSPWAFGEQFSGFIDEWFFAISDGLFEFPLLGGQMHYPNFAAFWFVYFGLLLIVLGVSVDALEEAAQRIPKRLTWCYLVTVLVGVFMIPFSGMTFLMLPHAGFMLLERE